MVDISAFAAARNSIKIAGEIAKSLVGIRDEREFQARAGKIEKELAEARLLIAEAQTTVLHLLNSVRELEAEVAQHEAWEAEKARYDLIELPGGGLVYRVQEAMRGAEPLHHLCPACFHKREKSIMQPAQNAYGTP